MDWIIDWIIDWIMDWIMDSNLDLIGQQIVFYLGHSKKTVNAGFPNEQGIGLTVGKDMCSAFSKTGWWV